MSVVVKAKIKELAEVNGKKLNVANDLSDRLDDLVSGVIKKACERALANGRTTVMPKDL